MSTDLKRIVEAVLFAAETPLSLAQICQVLETKDKAPIENALAELSKEYDFLERAFDLVEVAGGWRLRTRPEMAFWLRKLKRQSTTRLSRASLETLAIIAYKQPVLKAEIERIRGVEVSGVLRMLMEKDLVRVVGRKDLPGRPLIYGTTRRFLEVFDLKDLSDLPTLEEMQELLGEPDVVREEEQDEAPLFTRGMAGQDGDDGEGGEEGDGGGEVAEGLEEGEEDGAEGEGGPVPEGDEPMAYDAMPQDEAPEQAPELEQAEAEPDKQAESYIEAVPDQKEPEVVPDQIEPETAEQEPTPAYEQPVYQSQAQAEPMPMDDPMDASISESTNQDVADPFEQPSSAGQSQDQPQEQAPQSTEQDVPRIEPKTESEGTYNEGDPGGDTGGNPEGGPEGDSGGDSGPRAA